MFFNNSATPTPIDSRVFALDAQRKLKPDDYRTICPPDSAYEKKG